MAAEGNDLRTKSFKTKDSLSFVGSLLGGKVFVFIVRGACVLFGGGGRGSEKGQFVFYELLGLHFVYLLIIYVFIGFYLCLSGSL